MRKIDSKEQKRLYHMSVHERRLQQLGYKTIAGVDEAGRGPLAGPVVAAACILPQGRLFAALNDSKQLTGSAREILFKEISAVASYGIGIVSVERIDEINILQAALEAMQIALSNLSQTPDYVLVDGNRLPKLTLPAEALVAGDALSVSIAAASILAKVTRDRLMVEWARQWPHYGFEKHKGYGTAEHLEAIGHFGPCPIHRKSFEPIRSELVVKLQHPAKSPF